MDAALDELLRQSEAVAALVIDKGGPLIVQRGDVERFDTTTMAALAAGSYSATQAIAERMGETNFSSVYQQGEQCSLLVCNVDENLLLVVVFKADLSAGAVKFYAGAVSKRISDQLERAKLRAPESTVDLVSMNVLDATPLFKKKTE